MGQMIEATCPCGFHVPNLFVGGGMANFETYCGAPAFCARCSALHVLNYLDPVSRCPECGGSVTFYNDPALLSLPADEAAQTPVVFSWDVEQEAHPFLLPDVDYLCPKCRHTSMRFVSVGCWD